MCPQDVDGSVDAAERALRALVSSLHRQHPSVSWHHIEDIVRRSYERTRDARVQQFRLILAEREARAQLRLEHTVRDTTEGAGGTRCAAPLAAVPVQWAST